MTDRPATSSLDTEILWAALNASSRDYDWHKPWRWQDRVRDLGEDVAIARHRALYADSPITAGLRKIIADFKPEDGD